MHVEYDSTFFKNALLHNFFHVRYGEKSAMIHLKRDVWQVTAFYTECLKSLKIMSSKVMNAVGLKDFLFSL